MAVHSLTLVSAKFFFRYVSSGKGNIGKNKQMELHQTKQLFTVKETISKMKRQPIEWEKIFANDIPIRD